MTQLNPYVRFNDGKCREAMMFYQECIGGELTFQTVGETPMVKDMPPEKSTLIMHATLKNGGVELYASDMMRDKAVVGDNIALSLNTTTEAETNAIFEKLSRGGSVFMPVEKQFWGALFGVLTDKYGVEWMVNMQMPSAK